MWLSMGSHRLWFPTNRGIFSATDSRPGNARPWYFPIWSVLAITIFLHWLFTVLNLPGLSPTLSHPALSVPKWLEYAIHHWGLRLRKEDQPFDSRTSAAPRPYREHRQRSLLFPTWFLVEPHALDIVSAIRVF